MCPLIFHVFWILVTGKFEYSEIKTLKIFIDLSFCRGFFTKCYNVLLLFCLGFTRIHWQTRYFRQGRIKSKCLLCLNFGFHSAFWLFLFEKKPKTKVECCTIDVSEDFTAYFFQDFSGVLLFYRKNNKSCGVLVIGKYKYSVKENI